MNIIQAIRKSASAIVFVAIVVGFFWLMQKKVSDNLLYCSLVSICVAFILTYFQSNFVAETIEQSETAMNSKNEVKGLRAQQKRLEEKIQKLTEELEVANSKLNTEISEKPLDQRQLQQQLKNLNCLYALSKIVNRQGSSLEQIFQETVNLIRQTYRYSESTFVRLIFDGVRIKQKIFKKVSQAAM